MKYLSPIRYTTIAVVIAFGSFNSAQALTNESVKGNMVWDPCWNSTIPVIPDCLPWQKKRSRCGCTISP